MDTYSSNILNSGFCVSYIDGVGARQEEGTILRIQFQIFLWVMCLNLAVGLAMAVGVPGTAYVGDTSASEEWESSTYSESFNATEIADRWKPDVTINIPVVGDVFSAFQVVAKNLPLMLNGLFTLLHWIGDTLITDASALSTYELIITVLNAIFWVMMAWFFIEFISGRNPSD